MERQTNKWWPDKNNQKSSTELSSSGELKVEIWKYGLQYICVNEVDTMYCRIFYQTWH